MQYRTLAMLTAVAAGPLQAAEDQQDRIIVTATRTAQTADETIAPVTIIDRNEIDRSQAHDVGELLRQHAGIDFARNGGPGQTTSLFIRGAESNHVLVLIDGVRINPGTIGSPAVQHVAPEMVERIEIVKGPRSALYGSEAIGGVVNIITRKGKTGSQLEASVGAGRYGARQFSAGYRHAGDVHFSLDGAVRETDGFPTLATSSIDRGGQNTSFKVSAGTGLGPVDTSVSHWEAFGTTEYLDFFASPLDQDFRNSASAVTLSALPAGRWGSTLHVSRMVDEIDQNQSADFAHTERYILDWQNDIQLGSYQLLTAGVYLSREDTDASVFGTTFEESTSVNAAYVQDDVQWRSHHIIGALRLSDHDAFGTHTTGSVDYAWAVTQGTSVTLGAGTAFRAPDATDRFGFGGDPNLEAEKSRNLEAGLRHRFSDHQRARLSVFENRIDDLIEYDLNISSMVNIGKARIRGLEAAYGLEAGPWLANLEAIWQKPENLDTGEQLPRRAEWSVTTRLVYARTDYQLGLDVTAVGQRNDSVFNDFTMHPYTLLRLTAGKKLSRHWSLAGRIDNLLGENYEVAKGYNTAGRAAFVQLRFSAEERP